MDATALWHISPEMSELRSDALKSAQDLVRVEALYSLVSTGTELLVARGEVPSEIEPEMAVPYMEGSFDLPVKYGYSMVGRVRATGDIVHLMHPHQDVFCASRRSLWRVPEGIPPRRATLVSNLETAVTALWDGHVLSGDNVLVVGFGIIGSLIAHVAGQIPGVRVAVLEIAPRRMQLAKSMGFFVAQDLHDIPEVFDVAFNCSASAHGLQDALDAVGREGRVVELSWYGSRPVTLELGSTFHSLRKRIISSQVGQIPGFQQPRWSVIRRKQLVFRLLFDESFDKHITTITPFSEIAEKFITWRTNPPDEPGVCIEY